MITARFEPTIYELQITLRLQLHHTAYELKYEDLFNVILIINLRTGMKITACAHNMRP